MLLKTGKDPDRSKVSFDAKSIQITDLESRAL